MTTRNPVILPARSRKAGAHTDTRGKLRDRVDADPTPFAFKIGDNVRALRDGPARIDGDRLPHAIESGRVYLVADVKRGNLYLDGGDIFGRLAVAKPDLFELHDAGSPTPTSWMAL